jgi:hypothetical protein
LTRWVDDRHILSVGVFEPAGFLHDATLAAARSLGVFAALA